MLKKLLSTFLMIGGISCLSQTPAYAQQPSIAITPPGPVLCAGTKLDAVINNLNPPYTYQWSTGDTTASIFIQQTGFYRVRVSGIDLGGQPRSVRSGWYPYFVIPIPNAGISASGSTTLCDGQTVDLTATGGFFFSDYAWNTGADSTTITVNQSGTYAVTITNNFAGCVASSTDSIDVAVVDPSFEPPIYALGPLTVCKPAYVTLYADSGYQSYHWSTGDSTQQIGVLMDGLQQGPVLDTLSVFLTVYVNPTCSLTNSTGVILRSIRQPKLGTASCGNFSLSTSDSIKSENVLGFNGMNPQYEFEFEETSQPGITWTYLSADRWCPLSAVSPAILPLRFYNVRVRPVIGGTPYCYGSYCQIGISPNRPLPGAPSQQSLRLSENGLQSSVYPNPSSSDFRVMIFSPAEGDIQVRLFDLNGRALESIELNGRENVLSVGESLPSGVYILQIQQGSEVQTQKLVKSSSY